MNSYRKFRSTRVESGRSREVAKLDIATLVEISEMREEWRNVEILKIRFGEATLQVCEVMLKDMTDSKRIDGHVQSQQYVCPASNPCSPCGYLTKFNCSVHRPSHHHIQTLLGPLSNRAI